MLRGAWTFLVFLVMTPICGSYAILSSLARSALGRPHEIDLSPAKAWSRSILKATGVSVTYEGLDNIPPEEPCIFAVNHASNLDIWAVMPALPLHTKFVAKISLFKVPVMGAAMRRLGFIAIDRGRRQSAIQSLRKAAEQIRAGRSVIVFPEGTRSKDGKLQSFKKGSFHLALQAEVPIVPVAITGTWEALPPGEWHIKQKPVVIRFLAPIPTTEFLPDNHRGLMQRTHEAIAEALESHHAGTTPAARSAGEQPHASTSRCDNAP